MVIVVKRSIKILREKDFYRVIFCLCHAGMPERPNGQDLSLQLSLEKKVLGVKEK